MTKWVIYANPDKTEKTLTTRYNWDAYPGQHRYNPDGSPNKIVKEFDASSHEEAKKVFDKHWGHT